MQSIQSAPMSVRPSSLTDRELFHYAANMRENHQAVPQEWVDEMIRRHYERRQHPTQD